MNQTPPSPLPSDPLPTFSTTSLTISWRLQLDHPISQISLARETGDILARDQQGCISLINRAGKLNESIRSRHGFLDAVISDNGQRVCAISEKGILYWLTRNLKLDMKFSVDSQPVTMTLSPHGEYTLISFHQNNPVVYDIKGERIDQFDTTQSLDFMEFVSDAPHVITASDTGSLARYAVHGTPVWKKTIPDPIDDLSITGNGDTLFLATGSDSLQRYSGSGKFEGNYQFNGPVTHTCCSYQGDSIVVLEHETNLVLINRNGQILWNEQMTTPVTDLVLDALGTTILVALENGELVCFSSLDSGNSATTNKPEARQTPLSQDPIPGTETHHDRLPGFSRKPSWRLDISDVSRNTRGSIFHIQEQPFSLSGFIRDRLHIFQIRERKNTTSDVTEHSSSGSSRHWHRSEPIPGSGKLISGAPGIIVAATDRRLIIYSQRSNDFQLLDQAFAQISHLACMQHPRVIVVIESGDQVNGISIDGKRLWSVHTENSIHEAATGLQGHIGVTTDQGELLIFSHEGNQVGNWTPRQPDSLNVAGCNDCFFTYQSREQVIRAHDETGQEIWSTVLPGAAWSLRYLGHFAIATTPQNQIFAVDHTGRVYECSRDLPGSATPCCSIDGGLHLWTQTGTQGELWDWNGSVRWRTRLQTEIPAIVQTSLSGMLLIDGTTIKWFDSQHGS